MRTVVARVFEYSEFQQEMTRINGVRRIRDVWTVWREVSHLRQRGGIEKIVLASVDCFRRRNLRSVGGVLRRALRRCNGRKSDNEDDVKEMSHEVRRELR